MEGEIEGMEQLIEAEQVEGMELEKQLEKSRRISGVKQTTHTIDSKRRPTDGHRSNGRSIRSQLCHRVRYTRNRGRQRHYHLSENGSTQLPKRKRFLSQDRRN